MDARASSSVKEHERPSVEPNEMIATEQPSLETVEAAEERRDRERREALALAERYGLDYVDMDLFRIDNDLFRSIPFDLMLRYEFVPEQQLDGRLAVVMADPSDVTKIDEMELALGQQVEVRVGARAVIEEILQKSESAQRVLDEATEDFRMQLVQEDEEG
jgi:type IV pilus assembly protein PilB